MAVPVFQVEIGKRSVIAYHQHILRVSILRGLSKIETAGYQRRFRAPRVDHHDFVMGAGVLGVSKDRYTLSGNLRNQARGNPVDLVLVRKNFNVHSPLPGCNQCVRYLAMGKTECLHQDLALSIMNRISDELVCIISRRESHLHCAGGG